MHATSPISSELFDERYSELLKALHDSPRSITPKIKMENPPPTQELDAYRSYYDNKGQSDVVFVLAEVLDLVQMDIEIEIRDCSDRIFQKVLEYIYHDTVEITHEDVWTLYQMSELYELSGLTKKCKDYIISCITPDNVWSIHRAASDMGAREIMESCQALAQSYWSVRNTPTIQHSAGKSSFHPYQSSWPVSAFGHPGAPVAAMPTGRSPPSTPFQPIPHSSSLDMEFTTMRPQECDLGADIPLQATATPPNRSAGAHVSIPSTPPLPPSFTVQKTTGAKVVPPTPGSRLKLPSSPEERGNNASSRSTDLQWSLENLSTLTHMAKTLLDARKNEEVTSGLVYLTESSADRISLFLFDEHTNELVTLVNDSCEIRVPYNTGIAGAVFTSGKSINCRDPYSDSRFLIDVDKQTGYKTHTILAIPIILPGGRVSGVIEALNKQGKPGAKSRPYFTEKDEQALENICRLAAQLLERVPEYFPSLKVNTEASQQADSKQLEADGITVHPYKRSKRKNTIPIFHFKVPVMQQH